MPRIDPAQLLNCLQVLLSPTGGILSEEEVPRLASLMTKFSKKLVSKCVYVLILKSTQKNLLNAFMGCGGWTLIQLWLHDSMYSSNWVLVKELLELLVLTPVDVERLKSNNIPKLVKSLSKREDLEGVCRLASQLVQQWLKIVKDETQSEQQKLSQAIPTSSSSSSDNLHEEQPTPTQVEVNSKPEHPNLTVPTKQFYKLSLAKEPRQAVKTTTSASDNYVADKVQEDESVVSEEHVFKERDKTKVRDDKRKLHDKSRSKTSSSKNVKSSHKDKLTSKSKDKDKDKHHSQRDKEKDRHRSNGSVASSSSSTSSKHKHSSSNKKDKDRKESKDKQEEKDQHTLHQVQLPSIHKLPKIPKKSSDDKNKEQKGETQKGSISIEVRKTTDDRPKTVKVYKSKMRSTGLEEEAKPAPPRGSKKPAVSSSVPVPVPVVAPLKRPSPIRDILGTPPEKKSKIEVPLERPGAIKLIPPKPKPAILQESDMFNDALTAATTKKEPKKRKRRTSASKDSATTSPPPSPSTVAGTPPIAMKNISPPKFYQDTLQTDESKAQVENDNHQEEVSTEELEEPERPSTPMDITEDKSASELNANGLKSVLVYVRRKGPKKSIKWKADDELVDIRYFELDESERVNVTRAFGDMAKMDVRSEREALQMSRKLPNEDTMEAQTPWKVPTEIDLPESLVVPGSKSFERDIQFAREKGVLQALYFNKRMLPDSPGEPDPESYQIKDPIPIPVEDVETSNHDFRQTPWPEPKGSPPRVPVQNNPPVMFHNNPQPMPFQGPPNIPPPNFQNIKVNVPPPMFNPQPAFIPPQQNIQNAEWNARNMPPNMHMMQQNIPIPELMAPVPPLFVPFPDNFNPGMNDMNQRFPAPFVQQGPPPGLFQPNNFNPNRGGFGGRGRGNHQNSQFGGFRRGGSPGGRGGGVGGPGGRGGGWMRMSGPNQKPWGNNPRNNHRRGGGGNYERECTSNADMY